MSVVKNYFKNIVAKQKEIGHYLPALLRAPATIDDINEAEEKVGFKFNEELKDLYLFANGTESDTINPSGKTCLYSIHNFLSLEDSVSLYNHQKYNAGFDYLFEFDTGYKPGIQLFPFLEDGGGGMTWVDLNFGSPNYGKILETSLDGDWPNYTFPSLTSFFQALEIAYNHNIFWIDEDGLLDMDYDAWYNMREESMR